MKKLIYLFILAAPLFHSCAPKGTRITRAEAYPAFYNEQHPLSIIVMPPVNKTTNVDAKENFYITMSRTLAERGYYVVSPFLAMEMFQSESAYDAEMFITAPLNQFREVTGADLALFTNIVDWKKSAIGSKVVVTVEYIMRSTVSNETVFQRTGTITYDTSVNTGAGGLAGAIANVAASAISTAVQSYLPIAGACNEAVLSDIPAGKYNPSYNTDQSVFAGPKTVSRTVKK
ncbi:MAG: DUF799 domain-containing protein [Bacteroidales bacterium]|jgi:hypothetical protein|nr:DUF799 domain-containing protein [Bacteroidales bacterium]